MASEASRMSILSGDTRFDTAGVVPPFSRVHCKMGSSICARRENTRLTQADKVRVELFGVESR